ncbi:putative NAD(P)/FAD-binding protein YdhS [Neorhizobium huautlense]|uniref:NAD(P)/FAD-binding protein YdhS n=1 Tax=Neorhizobium huautlense TaxID=67774 RepID=A0ABT9PY92_9HYPH|nr:FAD/NAD(P)-binding protein [Neorhizobium huautlense]MDP9838704.1 putative NAD(P)/FAD-binding protein YdhS [Neorhizobium huautlense]
MRKRVAIVGSGPTALYALQDLTKSKSSLAIVIFEDSAIAGKGTPYQRGINDPAMLSNIPSIEIPDLPETLVAWLAEQSEEYLSEFEIERIGISDRAFYPRVVIGDYFRAQFERIVAKGEQANHTICVCERSQVADIAPSGNRFVVKYGEEASLELFDYVIVATGHSFPSAPETSPGYFAAPWPATALQSIPSGKIGVLGTSLSAIDAVMTVATMFGRFDRNADGCLNYQVQDGHEGFEVSMMSRKGLLPEADFFFPIPYEDPLICTTQAVAARMALGSSGLLDDVFDLLRQELLVADPEYAQFIGLNELTVDTFAAAYYGVRDSFDPFEWAASNLDEAKRNYAAKRTVAWRYAILIIHEIIETAVSYFTAEDLERFNRSFKSIFADDYATVPHLSIERLIALRKANRLNIIKLGDRSEISSDNVERGAIVTFEDGTLQFDTFIDATGQKTLSADDLPFPSLHDAGLISQARTVTPRGNLRRTGGIDVDEQCRPLIAGIKPVRRLHIPAVSYLLHKRPFVQGITSAAELGQIVARSVIADLMRPARSRRAATATKSPKAGAIELV